METQPFLVTGQLSAVKRDRIAVSAGGTKVETEIADDVQITVDFSDLTWAREGDSVLVEGWTTEADKTKVVAERLTVTGTTKLSLDAPKADAKKKGAGKDAKDGKANKD